MGGPAPLDETRGVSLGRPGWTLLASSDLTGGAFELFEELRASPSGPPPHVHRDRDETFYVLEGRYAFTRGTDEIEVGPVRSFSCPGARATTTGPRAPSRGR
jgi:mannose-6-phosphate isomerase-like protein (cupin superfamily)